MIRLLSPDREPSFLEAVTFDPLPGAKIHTLWKMYGADPRLLLLWLIEGPDSSPKGAMALHGGRLLLSTKEDADPDELKAFLPMLGGIQKIEGAPALLEKLELGVPLQRATLTFSEDVMLPSPFVVEETPPLREVYALLSAADEEFAKQSRWEVWYVHTSHLVRHGLGFVFGIRENGKLVSTGGIYAIGPQHGVIEGVATQPEYRGKGYGARVVQSLVAKLRDLGKIPVLACGAKSLVTYYAGLGFVPIGSLGTIRNNQE